MLFSSPTFLFLYLPLILAGYFVLPGIRLKNLFLLLASLCFYAWGESIYAGLLLISIIFNYGFGLWLGRVRDHPHGRLVLTLGVALNLGLLGFFKYTGFLAANFKSVARLAALPLLRSTPLHLPIGLSFFTFQALSYIFDVFRGRTKPQKNPLNLALYISLFPQLILGPIVRYHSIAPQLKRRTVTPDGFASGVARFITGLGKKVLLADTLAVPAERIFAIPLEQLTPGLAWLGVTSFGLQLYFDFSAYSDMAIGLGRMFGFNFRENFRYPFVALSRSDFFRRWHISFFTWMRDYLYSPLAGRSPGPTREFTAILLLFFLSGIWHGASWAFVVWGLYCGAQVLLERFWLNARMESWWRPARHLYLLGSVAVGMVFFRSESIGQALAFLSAMAGQAAGAGMEYHTAIYLQREVALALLVGVIASMPAVPWLIGWWERLQAQPRPGLLWLPPRRLLDSLGAVALAVILLASILVISGGTHVPFVYFQF